MLNGIDSKNINRFLDKFKIEYDLASTKKTKRFEKNQTYGASEALPFKITERTNEFFPVDIADEIHFRITNLQDRHRSYYYILVEVCGLAHMDFEDSMFHVKNILIDDKYDFWAKTYLKRKESFLEPKNFLNIATNLVVNYKQHLQVAETNGNWDDLFELIIGTVHTLRAYSAHASRVVMFGGYHPIFFKFSSIFHDPKIKDFLPMSAIYKENMSRKIPRELEKLLFNIYSKYSFTIRDRGIKSTLDDEIATRADWMYRIARFNLKRNIEL